MSALDHCEACSPEDGDGPCAPDRHQYQFLVDDEATLAHIARLTGITQGDASTTAQLTSAVTTFTTYHGGRGYVNHCLGGQLRSLHRDHLHEPLHDGRRGHGELGRAHAHGLLHAPRQRDDGAHGVQPGDRDLCHVHGLPARRVRDAAPVPHAWGAVALRLAARHSRADVGRSPLAAMMGSSLAAMHAAPSSAAGPTQPSGADLAEIVRVLAQEQKDTRKLIQDMMNGTVRPTMPLPTDVPYSGPLPSMPARFGGGEPGRMAFIDTTPQHGAKPAAGEVSLGPHVRRHHGVLGGTGRAALRCLGGLGRPAGGGWPARAVIGVRGMLGQEQRGVYGRVVSGLGGVWGCISMMMNLWAPIFGRAVSGLGGVWGCKRLIDTSKSEV